MTRSLLTALLALPLSAFAQISYNGGVYSQNFDTLPGTTNNTLNTTWTNNSTLAGWYANKTTFSVTDGTVGGTAATFSPTAAANTNNVGLFSFGTAASADRALGSRATAAVAGNNPVLYGVRLVNNTAQTLTSFTVTYTGEQWFKSGKTTADTILFDYQLGATAINTGTWVNASGGTFTSLINTATAATVAGNTAANRRGIAVKVTGVSWAPNTELWVRFNDGDNTGDEQGMAIDDFYFIADNESGVFFNGSTSYVTMGQGATAASLNASNFTIECRFMRTGPGVIASTGTGGITTALPLVAKGVGEGDGSNLDANYFLGIDNVTGKLVADFEQFNATVDPNGSIARPAGQNFPVFGSTVLQNGVFYHVAATYDTSTATWKLYVNGVAETTTQTLPTFVGVVPRPDNIQGLGIGTTINSTGARQGFFHGIIDEVRIWNVVRTPAQIVANKDLPITTGTAGLLGRYGFNEATGTTAAGINAAGTASPVGTLAGSPLPIWSNSAALVLVNTPPSVTISAITAASPTVAPAAINLSAAATDIDGTVTQVEFLRDGVVINTDTTAPFEYTDTGVAAGLFTYTARATDNSNATGLSTGAKVSVLSEAGKSALLFDGTNDYVTMGAAPELNVGGPPGNGLTLECWFRREGTGLTSGSGNGGVTAVPLFGKGRGEVEGTNQDCDIFFGVTTAGILVADFETYPATGLTAGQNYPITATNTPIVNNQWYHAAVTYDNATNTWKMYLDGVQVGTASAAAGAAPRFDSIQHFGIGAAFNSTGVSEGAFAGRIDEARVWNYARSAADIAASKDYEIATGTGLLGRYGLNEGAGTTIANTLGTPSGTLTNGPLWVDGPTYAVNTPPVVALTAPADGTTVMTGGIASLAATTSDTDGISKVEFYAGSTLIGTDTSAPYSFDWVPTVAADYIITAKAYDALSTTTTSAAITLHVIPNIPPTAVLTAPLDNATYTAPAMINFAATATDTDGSIAKVEFYSGTTKLGEDTTEPYTFSWTTVPAGDYTLISKSIDNLGASTTSTAIAVHVMPPVTDFPIVSITAPANNASIVTPGPVNITADATDTDGTITKVEFFNGATKLGEDTTAPYSYSWTGVALGDYTLTAKATDDMTAATTSSAIIVHVVANSAPVVTVTSPANNATGIGASTSIELGIDDVNGDAQTVNYFGRVATPATAGPDFTLVAIPDTQYYSENTARNPSTTGNPAIDTGATAAIYNSQMNWIVSNRSTRNIAFVSHMGDIAQNGDSFESEWIVASNAQARIENPLTTLLGHGIPWGCAPGNHDQQPGGDAGGLTNYYTKYFNFTRWDNRPYYGGHFGTKPIVSGGAQFAANTNNYQLFSASGLDFIVIHLEYDARAKSFYQATLDWADALLKAYPNRRAIVTSHWIVNTGNPASFSTQGQNIYDDLKDNPNLFLMLCGHVHGEGRRSDTFAGRTVHSILSDYQETKNGGNGFLRALTFKPSTNTIHVESYSPWVNRAVDATDAIPSWTAAYDLTYDMQAPVTSFVPLGTVNVPAAGTTSSLSWTGLEQGKSYEWYATVNDSVNTVTTATSRFSTTANTAPTVAITSPANNFSTTAPASFTVTADASDADGTVSRVEFYQGSTKIGEDTTAPYEQSVTGLLIGAYTYSAIAVDNSGASTLSSLVNVTVNASLPPVVSITAPANNATFDAPATISITADATDPDGTLAKVEFFNGATKLGEDTTAPYSYDWLGAFSGSYTLTARATDNATTTATSAAIAVTVTNTDNVAPIVSITSPSNNSSVAPAVPLTLNATASDTDGTVSKVEFFDGATLLGEDTTAPFSFTITSLTAGAHTFTAKATDNDAGTTISSVVNVTGDPALWAYSQNFDALGTGTSLTTIPNWGFYGALGNGTAPNTNSLWTDATGIPAGSITPGTLNNTLAASTTYPPTPASSNTAGYNFALAASPTDRALGTSPTSGQGLALQLSLTNPTGNDINAIRLGYDTRRFASVATANELPGHTPFYSLDNGTTWNAIPALVPTIATVPNTVGVTTVPPTTVALAGPWANGATLLIRWIDDNAVATSPDQIIGLDNVTITLPIGQPPTVALTAPANGSVSYVGDTINLTADAADADGTITKVEFYQGSTKLGEDTTVPYEYAWSGFAIGNYSLTARSTDNDGNIASSSVVAVSINATPGSGTLTRSPYLSQNNQNSIVVRWRTSQSVAGRVRYGTTSTNLDQFTDETTSRTDHEVKLTGLTPYTRYYYSVGSAFDTLTPEATDITSVRSGTYTFAAPTAADYTFRTSPTPGTATNTRVWIVGDCGRGSATQAAGRDAYYNWMGSRVPDLNLQLGDNAYNSGTDTEYQTGYFAMYPTIFRKMPQWSTLGNHDANNGDTNPLTSTHPYFSMFTFPTAGECGGVASGTEHYYSFDYGNIHFICLDSQTTLASRTVNAPQTVWLQNDLASTTKTWIIAFFHHPPYSKGSHDSDTEGQMVLMRDTYNPILEAGGVDLVLTGHSHNYERSVLLDGNYGTTGTITAAMKKNAGNGSTTGFTTSTGGVIRNAANGFIATATVAGTVIPPNGAYMKPLTGPRDHFGAVYNTAGMSGQADGGALNHSAMYISYNQVGTVNLDINGNTLVATFIQSGGTAPDNYTITKAGAADSDGDGLTDEYEIANGLNRFSAADANANGDGDGLSNFMEFAFGTNPLVSDGGQMAATAAGLTTRGMPITSVASTANGVDFRAAFCRRKDWQSLGLTYTVQFSADLTSWVSSAVTPTLLADDGEIEAVTVKYPFFVNGRKAQFFRVSVSH